MLQRCFINYNINFVSYRSQLDRIYSCGRILAWSYSVIRREDHGDRPPLYGMAKYLTGRSIDTIHNSMRIHLKLNKAKLTKLHRVVV